MTRVACLFLGTLLAWLGSGDAPVPLAGWIAPAFFLRFLRDSSPKSGLPLALLALAGASFVGYFGMSPVPPVVFALSALVGAALELLAYALDRALVRILPNLAGTLVLPCSMVTLAWLQSLGDGTAGNIAYLADDRLSQFAALAGIWPLVFLPYWVAACANLAWERRHRPMSGRPLVLAGGAILAALAYGSWRLDHFHSAPRSLRVAGVTTTPEQRQRQTQLAAPLFEGRALDEQQVEQLDVFGREVFEALLGVSVREARAGAELVVWSEAAVPTTRAGEAHLVARAREVAREQHIVLGLGLAVLDADARTRMEAGQPFLTNRLVMIGTDGEVGFVYEKARLVPGYEATAFHPGDGRLAVMNTRIGPVAGAICFDADFPALIRQAGRSGAAVLVVPSNDWLEIRHLHARVARMRAVENGLSLLRPTSAGVSIATDPAGQTVAQVDFFVSRGAPLVAQLPIMPEATLYGAIGDVVAHACAVSTAGFVLVGLVGAWGRRRARSASSELDPRG